MKIVIAVLLLVSLMASGFGTWWSTRPVVTMTPEQKAAGEYTLNFADSRWKQLRGALSLGAGLILTTIAGLVALVL
ncbi:hypothetical protein [Curtobacterium flaccumfaciens]|uniref:hypothetical protein n=1 Tax=Curtobacterium flaccumfaciens TaxID=2035 RepID=UPI00399581C3